MRRHRGCDKHDLAAVVDGARLSLSRKWGKGGGGGTPFFIFFLPYWRCEWRFPHRIAMVACCPRIVQRNLELRMCVFVHSVFSLRNKGTFSLHGKCEGGDKWERLKAQKERGARRCLLTIFQRSEIVPLLSSPSAAAATHKSRDAGAHRLM